MKINNLLPFKSILLTGCLAIPALFTTFGSHVAAQPFFQCTSKLDDPYGVCSHITRNEDYNMRSQNLIRIYTNQIGWVRSDFDFGTVMNETSSTFTPTVFDNVVKDCETYHTHFLPILDRGGKNLAWNDSTTYFKYLDYLLNRYKGHISHWEVMNEADLISGQTYQTLGQKYAGILKSIYRHIKTADATATVVVGGMSGITNGFLKAACDNGAYKYFDIMNFHSYRSPEDNIDVYTNLFNMMKQGGWNKHVWMTETGYSTPKTATNHRDFFSKIIPACLSRLGLVDSLCTLGVVCDPDQHLSAPSEEQIEFYSSFKQVRFFTLSDLSTVNPKEVQLLLPSDGEFFPTTYMTALTNYLNRGGTLICPQGVPFYYNAYRNGGMVQAGDAEQKKLHIGLLYWWTDEAKKLGAPEVPSWHKIADGWPDYGWNFDANHSARYLTAANLKTGDQMIPIVTAGNDQYSGCVAALYLLRSDLKGNLIIQTRMDPETPSQAVQAKRLPRAYLTAFAYGIDKVFWYNLRAFETSDTDPESHFGILHSNFSQKPAYVAYKVLTQMCPDGSTRPSWKHQGFVYQTTWQRPDGKYVSALWTAGAQQKIHLSMVGQSSLTNHLGVAVTPEDSSATGINLTVTSGPIYVVSDGEIPPFNVVETGIQHVSSNENPVKSNQLCQTYDLQGRPLCYPTKGIYIKGNRKEVVR